MIRKELGRLIQPISADRNAVESGSRPRRVFLFDWDQTLFPSFVYKEEPTWTGPHGQVSPYLTADESIAREQPQGLKQATNRKRAADACFRILDAAASAGDHVYIVSAGTKEWLQQSHTLLADQRSTDDVHRTLVFPKSSSVCPVLKSRAVAAFSTLDQRTPKKLLFEQIAVACGATELIIVGNGREEIGAAIELAEESQFQVVHKDLGYLLPCETLQKFLSALADTLAFVEAIVAAPPFVPSNSQHIGGATPRGNGRILRCTDVLKDKSKYMQLIPNLPADATHNCVLQPGSHRSHWVRLRSAAGIAALQGLVLESEGKQSGAVYVAAPQPLAVHIIPFVLEREYSFYNYHQSTDELIWYKWCRSGFKDMVPSYATSIEGGCAVVLSPDETKVLGVFECQRYGSPGGAVDRGESCLDGAIRECKEETGLEIDDTFQILLLEGYNQPCSRDGLINDHYMRFLVRAKSTELALEADEIVKAHWFDVERCVAAWASHQIAWRKEYDENDIKPLNIEVDGKMMAASLLRSIHKYKNGGGRPVERVTYENRPHAPRLVF